MDVRRKNNSRFFFRALILPFLLFVFVRYVFCANDSVLDSDFIKLQGEILEAEELREPEGSAIYMVKDFSSGRTLKLFADPYRTSVQKGKDILSLSEVLPGSKVTLIYKKPASGQLPNVVYIKLIGSY